MTCEQQQIAFISPQYVGLKTEFKILGNFKTQLIFCVLERHNVRFTKTLTYFIWVRNRVFHEYE